MLKKINYSYYLFKTLLISSLFCVDDCAYALQEPSLGQAAQNMLGPLGLFTGGFYKICFIIGGTLIIGAALQYKNYRDNPSAVRLSTPVVLFLLGLGLILLPIISMLSPAAPVISSIV